MTGAAITRSARAVLPPAPAQLELAGVAAPVASRPLTALLDAGAPLQICARARLVRDAVVRHTGRGGGLVWLEVLLHQRVDHHPQATPLFAALMIPDRGSFWPTMAYALRQAATLKAGTEVVVRGRGLETGRHHGEPVLRLLHTLGISRAEDTPTQQPEHANAH